MTKRGRPSHPDILTPAEWRVVEGVRHGLTNPAIAKLCGISTDAVKFHVSNSLGKLGFTNRRQLQQWPGARIDSALATISRVSGPRDWAIGQISRVTRDLEKTSEWLHDTIGIREIMRFDTMIFFDCGGLRLCLTQGDPTRNSILYFWVVGIHKEIERMRSASVEITSAPHRIHVHPDGTEEWMAFFNDPDGNPLALMEIVKPLIGKDS